MEEDLFESPRQLARRAHEALEANDLTMHDLPDGPGEVPGEDLAAKYPDWNEDTTFTVVGPVGGGKTRGLPFVDMQAAKDYYVGLHGTPVERFYWPAPPPDDGSIREGECGKYGFRFRKALRNTGRRAPKAD